MKRKGVAHILAFFIIVVLVLLVIMSAEHYYSQKQLGNSHITGTFQGSTTVNTGSGDEYIVKISNATVTCDSWTMTTADIYALTHMQPGQKLTMSLACSNIAVG